YKSANVIKKNILLSNESDLDTHNNISQYILELNIFEKISPDLDFLRPKLQAMQTAIQAMAPIMERNKIIMYDFRNCFINCNMSIEILHKNLIKLIDKYGLEILNDYAKYAWYFYNSFDIKTIIEETEMLLSNWQVDDNTLISSQAFLEKIDSHFFVEFRAHYEAYQQVEQILNNVLNKHVTNWNIEFLEEVVQLYEFKMSKGRVSSDVLVEIHMDVFVAIKEKSTKSEQLRTRDGTGDLLWRLVTRGFLVDNYQIEKIELAIEEKWQIYHYKVIFYLNQLITNYQQRFDNYNMHIRKLIVTIKDYIFNKQLYCTYKIALYFIGEEPVNTANDAILMEQLQEVKEIALLSLQYNNFELVNYI
ncbi:MAG TPA: hypothetical protein PKD00_09325, partial [Burkholderiales bacterium]|nr:hypothetical protein [Burkholderiales bacterium]